MKIESQIELSVLTPTRRVIEGKKVTEIAFPAALGEMDVLGGHLPFLGFLGIGHLHYTIEDGVTHIAIRNGFAELHNDRLIILAEEALLPQEIRAGEAADELKDVERHLGTDLLDESSLKELTEKYRWLSTQLAVSLAANR